MTAIAREDEPTLRVTLRKPARAEHVDVVAPARVSHVAPLTASARLRRPRLDTLDDAIDRMSAPVERARVACESTRTAALCLGATARDAGKASRERSASGTRVKTIPGMPSVQDPPFGDHDE